MNLMDTATGPLAPWQHPTRTATGAPRATVDFRGYETLWLNTGTRCNIACPSCYIESTPENDALVYLRIADAVRFLDELDGLDPDRTCQIGFTGGEPFMNPDMLAMLKAVDLRGRRALVLTNAMMPMQRPVVAGPLRERIASMGKRLEIRVSLDGFDAARHDAARAPGAFDSAMQGLAMLRDWGAYLSVAGRRAMTGDEGTARAHYAMLFAEHRLAIPADDPARLVLFAEMQPDADAPEITPECWEKVGTRPDAQMCASARMVVHRKGDTAPRVVACTLLPHDGRFDLGEGLDDARRSVHLAHKFCAQFCVLGGSSCSA